MKFANSNFMNFLVFFTPQIGEKSMIFISFFRTSIWEKLAFRLDGSTIFEVLSFEKLQQNLMKNHIGKNLKFGLIFGQF